MSRIDQVFEELRGQGKKALMPFITAGDPDLAFTSLLLTELAARGGSLCELGVPYSDPIADGPVIQASYTRALAHKIKLAQILDMLASATPRVKAPVVTMVSYAIVYRHGLARYVADAQKAGVAGAIVPDLPVEEAGELAKICRGADFSLVQLFLYYVSVTGITGERTELPQSLVDNVGWLREQTPLPIAIGFGISTPEHVRQLAAVADGLIVGSAVVRRVSQAAAHSRAEVVENVGDYVASLVAALDAATAALIKP